MSGFFEWRRARREHIRDMEPVPYIFHLMWQFTKWGTVILVGLSIVLGDAGGYSWD